MYSEATSSTNHDNVLLTELKPMELPKSELWERHIMKELSTATYSLYRSDGINIHVEIDLLLSIAVVTSVDTDTYENDQRIHSTKRLNKRGDVLPLLDEFVSVMHTDAPTRGLHF